AGRNWGRDTINKKSRGRSTRSALSATGLFLSRSSARWSWRTRRLRRLEDCHTDELPLSIECDQPRKPFQDSLRQLESEGVIGRRLGERTLPHLDLNEVGVEPTLDTVFMDLDHAIRSDGDIAPLAEQPGAIGIMNADRDLDAVELNAVVDKRRCFL